MSGGLVMLAAPAASAHTPDHDATCEGVWVKGTNYESKDTNTLSVTVGDETQTKTFSGTETLTVPVPADGEVYDWSASVTTTNTNADYSKSWSGTVGPCGEEKKVVVCKYVGTPPGRPDHIIVVNKSAAKDWDEDWDGKTFPWSFADAQDSVALRYAVGNEQPGDEELANCPERRTEKAPAGINAEDPCGPETGNVTWAAKSDEFFTYSESNGVVTATLKDPDKYIATGKTSWTLSEYETNEPCPFPPCPGAEQTQLSAATLVVDDQTPGCYEQKHDSSLSCTEGRYVRSWTEFRPWVWNQELTQWQLGKVEIQNDTGFEFDRPLTAEEFKELECQPDQPNPTVKPLSDQQLSCAGGVEQRSGTQTTTYVWNAESKKYDAVVGPEVWGDWTFVRPLDDAEFQRLQCQPGQPSPDVKPLSGERKTCEDGVEERSGSQTTTYVWNASTRVYDAVVGAEVWGDWTVVRALNSEEIADLQCVLGTESSAPKPDKTPKPHKTHKPPTVLGTQAVAPTAVDAGLASMPNSSGPSTTSLLAQLMVAGGLLLLLAGGWLGLGRREYGAHQA